MITLTARSEPEATRPVVLYAALREPSYVRNLVALRSLENAGFGLLLCTSRRRTYALRFLEVVAKLLRAAAFRQFDVVMVGFLAQPLVPLIRPLTRKPLVVDGFISLYDTLCFDRQRFRPRSVRGRLAHWLDRFACRQADIFVVDTEEHGDYFHQEFGIARSKLRAIPVGADDAVFHPRGRAKTRRPPAAFYYATGLPVHGLEHVLQAARLLAPKGIEVRVAAPVDLISDPPPNLTRLGWISLQELAQEMTVADVVLAGHFSTLPKARRVVAGKTYQSLACGRPTIVSDLPANRRVLKDGVTAFFCEAGQPASIAETVERVIADRAKAARVGRQARRAYEVSWHTDALTPLWAEAIVAALQPD